MKLFSSAVLFMGLAFGSLAYGQTPPQGAPPSEKPSDTPKVTITGCLAKGSTDNQYTIADQKTGEKIPFTGPAQIEKYLNQTVQMIGTMANKGQEKVFTPESISPIATTCQKSQ
ncbi:MAG: hypothetical protein C5B56_02090 [Proteobacteria bacterium]|nr:MAG: hypothetical protein C5B56_02090 [Pseudomonadota bacterium]